MSKADLETIILGVLRQQKVRNQRALVKILKEKGVKIDQSTLSRHLHQLGIEKKDGFYHLTEQKVDGNFIIPVPPNLIVVKTLPGHAQALAFKLDAHPPKGLVGTIAGDDTVLCIVESPKLMKSLCTQLLEY